MYIAHNMALRLRNITSHISYALLVFVLLALVGCDGTRYVADGDYLLGTLQEMAEGSASLMDVRVECTAQVSGHFGTVFFNEANSSYYLHVGTAIDASYQVDPAIYMDVLTQNFEGTNWLDNWTIVLPGRLTAVQQSNSASGSKSIWCIFWFFAGLNFT